MSLKQKIEKENLGAVGSDQKVSTVGYGLFCEQYLEKPVISGDYEMAISPTVCTIKGIPALDDF